MKVLTSLRLHSVTETRHTYRRGIWWPYTVGSPIQSIVSCSQTFSTLEHTSAERVMGSGAWYKGLRKNLKRRSMFCEVAQIDKRNAWLYHAAFNGARWGYYPVNDWALTR